jgi:hypothetical protein
MSPHEKQDSNVEVVSDGGRTAAPESEAPGNGAGPGDVEAGQRDHTRHWKTDEVQEIPHKYASDCLILHLCKLNALFWFSNLVIVFSG